MPIMLFIQKWYLWYHTSSILILETNGKAGQDYQDIEKKVKLFLHKVIKMAQSSKWNLEDIDYNQVSNKIDFHLR